MDYNNDGLMDIVAGDSPGNVFLFLNEGTKQKPSFAAAQVLRAEGKAIKGVAPAYDVKNNTAYLKPNKDAMLGVYSKIHVCDFDGDGKKDLVIAHDSPRDGKEAALFYRNIGTDAAPVFTAPQVITAPDLSGLPRPTLFVADWNGDGVQDAIIGTEGSEVYVCLNAGTNARPDWQPRQKIPLPGMPAAGGSGKTMHYRLRPCVVDWNNDGKMDLLIGTFYSGGASTMGGNVWLFLRK